MVKDNKRPRRPMAVLIDDGDAMLLRNCTSEMRRYFPLRDYYAVYSKTAGIHYTIPLYSCVTENQCRRQ